MWILIPSMLKPENKNHNEMRPCIIAAVDTVQGIAGRKIEDRSAEKDKYLKKYCTVGDETRWGLRSHVYQGRKFLAPAV